VWGENLATQNQNKFAVIGHDLANIARDGNYKYGFGTADAINQTLFSENNTKYQEETIQTIYCCKSNKNQFSLEILTV